MSSAALEPPSTRLGFSPCTCTHCPRGWRLRVGTRAMEGGKDQKRQGQEGRAVFVAGGLDYPQDSLLRLEGVMGLRVQGFTLLPGQKASLYCCVDAGGFGLDYVTVGLLTSVPLVPQVPCGPVPVVGLHHSQGPQEFAGHCLPQQSSPLPLLFRLISLTIVGRTGSIWLVSFN